LRPCPKRERVRPPRVVGAKRRGGPRRRLGQQQRKAAKALAAANAVVGADGFMVRCYATDDDVIGAIELLAVIGVCALLFLIVTLVYSCICRKSSRKSSKPVEVVKVLSVGTVTYPSEVFVMASISSYKRSYHLQSDCSSLQNAKYSVKTAPLCKICKRSVNLDVSADCESTSE